jgi:hypothetical protein
MILQAGFIFLALALIIVIYLMAVNVSLKAITDTKQQKRFIQRTGLVLVCWLTYVSAISVTGIFQQVSFPPRIPLLLVLPAFLFFIYFFTNKRFKTIIDHTPHTWPVFFQSFRVIVELLIWGEFMKGILPQSATFEGRNFDILIGLTAPLIAFFTFVKPKISKALFILWNIAGLGTLAIVVFILMRHAYFMPNEGVSILRRGFGDFPYTFLAGLFMPLAVFMHIFSLVKASRKSTH